MRLLVSKSLILLVRMDEFWFYDLLVNFSSVVCRHVMFLFQECLFLSLILPRFDDYFGEKWFNMVLIDMPGTSRQALFYP